VQNLARFSEIAAGLRRQELLGQLADRARIIGQRKALARQRREARLPHLLGQRRFQLQLVRASSEQTLLGVARVEARRQRRQLAPHVTQERAGRIFEGGRSAPSRCERALQALLLARQVQGPDAIQERDAGLDSFESARDLGHVVCQRPAATNFHSLLAAMFASSLRSPFESSMWPTSGSPRRRSAA
jgi:hypothetical protein